MKYFRYKFLMSCVCLLFGIFFSGCKKGWIDINYNPMQLTENNATPDIILPSLLVGSQSGNRDLNNWMGYWAYYGYPSASTSTAYFPLDYVSIGDYSPNTNVILFEQNAKRHDQPFYVGIAKVLRALTWSRAVDVYNNIPYTEAMDVNKRKPKYDNAQLIYEDLILQLDTAISLIKGASKDKSIKIGTADIMFKGDQTMWAKFANTLKLRLLIHQAARPDRETYIKAQIAKIIAEGSGFLNTGENADFNPGYTDQKPASYFSENSAFDIYTRSYLILGNNFLPTWELASANVTVLNFLKGTNDPRLGFFFNPVRLPLPVGAPEPFTQPGPVEFRGNKFGLQVDRIQYPYQESNYVSQVSGVTSVRTAVTPFSTGIIKGYNMDSWIMTSTESMFLQAEAIYRGWISGDAEIAYKNAVKESFRWLNVGGNSTVPQLSDAVFDTWYAQQVTAANVQVSWAAAPDKYKLLMFQKYMAFNGIEPFETWVDYRRNGRYPDIPLSFDPTRVGTILPIRMPYPAKESVVNGEELAKQGTIDPFTSKIWWMP